MAMLNNQRVLHYTLGEGAIFFYSSNMGTKWNLYTKQYWKKKDSKQVKHSKTISK